MALKDTLDSIVHGYLSDVHHIGRFVRIANTTLSQNQTKHLQKTKARLSKDKVIELRTTIETMLELLKKPIDSKQSFVPASPEVVDSLIYILMPFQERRFLAEMSLSYLVSYQEAFLKDYLLQVFIHRKQMLKSNASITYEGVLEHNSLKSLVKALAEKEVYGLGHGSIDDISKYFLNRLNIDIGKFPQWERLREINYRRNIIVHNRSVANETYCKKTGHKKVKEAIITDYKYVLEAVDVLSSFIEFIHRNCLLKLKLIRKKT